MDTERWREISRLYHEALRRSADERRAFLDDACRQGVLRRAGAVYQFRHARLQDHLTVPPDVGRAHHESAAA